MGDWRIGGELGHSPDDLNEIEGNVLASVGAAYKLSGNLELGGALVSSLADVPVLLPSGS